MIMLDGNKTGEVWLPIPGFSGYEVSSWGRIRGLARYTPYRWKDGIAFGSSTRFRPAKFISTPLDSHGYPHLNLRKDGTTVHAKVHRLVARAFIGEPPAGEEVRHIDGNPANCFASNLCYGTRKQNVADALRHGTIKTGELSPLAKLTSQMAREICSSVEDAKTLADRYGICRAYVSHIRTGRRWGDATTDLRSKHTNSGPNWYIKRGLPIPVRYTEVMFPGTADNKPIIKP